MPHSGHRYFVPTCVYSFIPRDNKIIAWKAFDVGEGKSLSLDELTSMSQPSTNLIIMSDFSMPKKPEGTIKIKKEENHAPKDQDGSDDQHTADEDEYHSHVFPCLESGCMRVFQEYASLESHILLGKHKFTNQVSVHDNIKQKWKESCCKITKYSTLSRGSKKLKLGQPSSPMGWALKKERKNPRFDEKVKTYLKGIFEAGERSGRKANPCDVSKNMRVCLSDEGDKMFRPDQCLQPSQITSYFSRLAVQSRVPSSNKRQKYDDDDLESVLNMMDALEAIETLNG